MRCYPPILGEVSPTAPTPKPDTESKEKVMNSRIEALTIQEDVKEGEADDEDGVTTYPYERLIISSTDPVKDIDVTKREVSLSITLLCNDFTAYFFDKFY